LNQQGLTILLTTHDMDEADRLCERVAIMDQGKILVNNTPAELKKMIPGGNALEIRVKIPDTGDTTAQERLRTSLQTLPGVSKVEQVENNAPTGKPAGPPASPWSKFAPAAAAPPEEELGVVTYRLYAQSASSLVGSAAQAVLSAGAEVRDLHLKQATLEEVFIYLTGRHLR
jgi:ABC-2 type transport system ATP-binding protein